jgi:hypothetical protein
MVQALLVWFPAANDQSKKGVFSLLPTTVTTDIANNAVVLGWIGISRPAQGRFGLVFSNQSQRI